MTVDPLTGAYARTDLEPQLHDALEWASRHDDPLALCVLDLDYFKSVNDAYGHPRGDEALRELASRVQARIRGADRLFRYGGDEFVLLLTSTPKAAALGLAHRVLDAVSAEPFPGTPPLSLSASIGLAAFPEDASDPDALFALADRRLYQAKRRGRRQVVGDDVDGDKRDAIDPLTAPERLIERDDALAEIQQFLARWPDQPRAMLRIAGPPGAGQTRLLAAATQAAVLRGHRVVRLRAAGRQTSFLASLPGPHDPAQAAPAAVSDIAELPDVLLNAATMSEGGVLIAADNLAQCDPDALDQLEEIFASCDVPRLAIAYTGDLASVSLLTPPAGCLTQTIELRPLTLHGLSIWLRGLLRREPPPAFLNWTHRVTGGLPAAIERTLAALMEQGLLLPTASDAWVVNPLFATATLPEARSAPPAAVPAHSLPGEVTSLIGRDDDIARVRALLGEHRLVTLLGPGGIGKTRLSQAVAAAVAPAFADGARFVPLAATSDPELVVNAIATTLGVAESPNQRPLDRLKRALRDRHQLLVLDNLEQALDAAPLIGELLAAAPRVSMLATSREPLRIYGEQRYPVRPLGLPDLECLPSAEQLADYTAIRLFAARARSVDLDFSVTDQNAAAVAALCARLDGLPLAIELAAARVDEFSPAEMLALADRRLALLAGGPRDLPARQQTLRGAIDWSYELLKPDQQRLFAQLAVFVGGCTTSAVEAICPHRPGDALPETLALLADKSLLLNERIGGSRPRLRMLETIREYALERLAERDDAEDLRAAHADYYRALAQHAASRLKGAEGRRWIERLEAEHDNLRAALAWALERGNGALAEQFGAALWRFWSLSNHVSEGRRRIEAILAAGAAEPTAARAQLLNGAGVLAWIQGDFGEARVHLERSLTASRAAGDHGCLAAALNSLGLVAREQGDYAQASGCFEEALDVWRANDDRWGVSVALGNLGKMALQQGDCERARAYTVESLALRRELGDQQGIALALGALGMAAWRLGEHDDARAFLLEGLAAAHGIGDTRTTASSLTSLARLAFSEDDYAEAALLCQEALALWGEIGHKEGVAESLEILAGVAGARANPERAARLLGAAEALRDSLVLPIAPAVRPLYERITANASAQLDATTWAAAWAEGRRLSMRDAVAIAFRVPAAA